MKALFTLGLVIDLEPDEIPEFAASLEQGGMASMYAGITEVLSGRELTDEQVALLREKVQVFGIAYSVLHELELESGV